MPAEIEPDNQEPLKHAELTPRVPQNNFGNDLHIEPADPNRKLPGDNVFRDANPKHAPVKVAPKQPDTLVKNAAWLYDAPDDLPWEEFDEKVYISKNPLKSGEDNYSRNKFNQAASDKTKSNREVPDTRNGLYVLAYKCRIMCGHNTQICRSEAL